MTQATKFKVGERVRLTKDIRYYGLKRGHKGVVAQVVASICYPYGFEYTLDGRVCSAAVSESELELVPSQRFKLNPGDTFRNNRTGRVGIVGQAGPYRGYVYDRNTLTCPSALVPVAAVEEYEEHYPGTYEIVTPAKVPF